MTKKRRTWKKWTKDEKKLIGQLNDQELANHLGISKAMVVYKRHSLGILPRRKWAYRPYFGRDREIVRLRKEDGIKLQIIGDFFKISKERVRQIVKERG